MPILTLTTEIEAPLERVFDLARSLDLHADSMHRNREVAVAGTTNGLIGLGESVTWRARHFFIPFRLTAKITGFDPPSHFRDEMVGGPFRRFAHEHFFEPTDRGTLMRDVFDYTSPLGIVGRLADLLFLRRHMLRLLTTRNEVLKRIAESDDWGRYVTP
jgi:ligand-binding SRPBCC domain-containing protein